VDFSYNNFFTVTFHRSKSTVEKTVEETVEKTVEETVGETVKNTSENTSEKTVEKILQLIRMNQEITIQEISRRLNKTTRAVEMQLNSLKEKNMIKRIGPNKGGYWEVLDKNL